ncbi:MAG: alpha-L-fucosidase [Kiritimatiellia bacterium]
MFGGILLAATFANPVLPADFSDLDCIRRDGRYYAISSTLHCSPGMDVLESADLINWRVTGHVVPDTSVFGPDWTWARLRRYGRGIWAGCLRERQGRLYCYFATPDEGVFVCTAEVASGPWSAPHKMAGFGGGWDDPGVLFNGDKAYLAVTEFGAGYRTYAFELTADGLEVVPETKTLINEGKGREANKLYKWHDTYYHLYSEVADGGRRLMMARAKNALGPYAERRVLSHPQREADEPNQGGFLTDDAGKWYFFTHHGRGRWYGRAASLLPVTWIDGWPVVGRPDENGIGTMVWTAAAPTVAAPDTARVAAGPRNENRRGFLNPEWAWNHAPRADRYELTDGRLRLVAFRPLDTNDFFTVGNVFTRRVFRLRPQAADGTASFTVALDAARQEEGGRAGLCHLGGDAFELGVTWLGRERGRCLYYRQNGREPMIVATNAPRHVVLRTVWTGDGSARFAYSFDGNSFTDAGVGFRLAWGRYRGDRVGLFSYATGREGGEVTFMPHRPTPEWYRNARFGIFCHWGPQCAAEAGDWYARLMYFPGDGKHRHHVRHFGDPKEYGFKDLAGHWRAENWNPDELCALYRRMGATFVLAMANHHDNFDLWDSKYQPWNAVNMGPKRDILGGWAAAARKHGLRFGASFHAAHASAWMEPSRDFDGLLTRKDGKGKWWEGYDPQDLYWQRDHEPNRSYRDKGAIHRQWNWGNGATLPSEAFRENFRLRTMDAIEKYRPDLIYYDDTVVAFWPIAEEGFRIVSDFYALNPEAVVTGKCLDETQRQWITWDVERGTPSAPMYPKWQTDTCIGSWHYAQHCRYKSARDVMRMLVDIVSKNGNLCLSIPIRRDGTIDADERRICEDIASWMAISRAAIFDSDPYAIAGEGPQLRHAPPISAQGFNESRIKAPVKEDVRYLKARDGRRVYAIEIAPDGQAPICPALVAQGLKLVKTFPAYKDFPLVHVFE